MPSLSVEERNRLLGQYQAGVSPTKLSKIFKVSRQAVYKILKKSKQENSLKNKHRSGRPKVTDAQTDANLVEIFRANPFKTVRSAISETGLKKRYHTATISSSWFKIVSSSIKAKID